MPSRYSSTSTHLHTRWIQLFLRAHTSRTKAVIPVTSLASLLTWILFSRSHVRTVWTVIEDAAQAHGAEYQGRRVGSIGDAGCFSFYPGKNLGAFGEAGAVVSGGPELQKKIRILRDHGQIHKYHHTMIGWNARMDGIQAAVLGIKLRHLEKENDLRRLHAAQYNEALEEIEELTTPFQAAYARHVYHIYAIRVPRRDEVIELLAEMGVACGIHYPVPIHLQDAYQGLGYEVGAFPIAREPLASSFHCRCSPG